MNTWEIRRDNVVLAHGPAETFPDARARKMFRNDGYKIFVDGKLYKD